MKRFLYRKILPLLGLISIKFLCRTYKIKIINNHVESNIFKKGHRPIYISWHQRFFPGIMFLSGKKPIAIIVSKSKDGDLISRIIEMLGWLPIRGSSSKGGTEALRHVKELSKSGYSIGHIVDGPKGPFGEVKPGLIAIARTSGMPILPVIITAEKKWIFNSWDKFIIPKPFSKIIIKYEEEIYIPQNSSQDRLNKFRTEIQNSLFKQYEQVDKSWL